MSYLKSILHKEHDSLKGLVEKYKNEISLIQQNVLQDSQGLKAMAGVYLFLWG